jgi:hypothetical protein
MIAACHRRVRVLAATILLALSATAHAQGPPPSLPAAPPPGPDAVLPQTVFPDQVPPPPTEWPPAPPPPPAPPADGPMPFSPFAGVPWASPVVGHVPYAASYRVTWLPEEAVQGQDARFTVVGQDASVRFPIWQSECDELSGSVNLRVQIISTSAILPNTLQPFPDQLWDVRFGAAYRHLFENGWIAGGSFSFGSASDQPFHSFDELTVGVNAFLRIPQGEHNAWLFSLSYSPTAQLNFPIPGVAFMWVPSEQFRMNIGLPFSVWYHPTEDVTLEASYMLLTTIHARATYRVCQPVRVYIGYDWSNESWFLVDRPAENDRFFYYEQRVSVGAVTNIGRTFLLDVSTGYVFERFYFEGAKSSDTHFNRVNVDAAPLLSLQAALRW